MKCHNLNSRVETLQRFLWWKTNFKWNFFPDDIKHKITEFLSDYDFLVFCYAIMKGEVHVPAYLRDRWLPTWLKQRLKIFIRNSFCEQSLYNARDCHRVVIMINWSQFSARENAVCEFSWTIHDKKAVINYFDEIIDQNIKYYWNNQVNSVRLTSHQQLHWNNSTLVHPEPMCVQQFEIIPYTLSLDYHVRLIAPDQV